MLFTLIHASLNLMKEKRDINWNIFPCRPLSGFVSPWIWEISKENPKQTYLYFHNRILCWTVRKSFRNTLFNAGVSIWHHFLELSTASPGTPEMIWSIIDPVKTAIATHVAPQPAEEHRLFPSSPLRLFRKTLQHFGDAKKEKITQ